MFMQIVFFNEILMSIRLTTLCFETKEKAVKDVDIHVHRL